MYIPAGTRWRQLLFMFLWVGLVSKIYAIPLDFESNVTAPNVIPFERLVVAGLSKLRLPYPAMNLMSITAFPAAYAPGGTRQENFRTVVITGKDSSTGTWLQIRNRGGDNAWNGVTEIAPPPMAERMLSFRWDAYPVSFWGAFERIRAAGLARPWKVVRISGERFLPDTGVSYIFSDASHHFIALVDVASGEVRTIPPSMLQGDDFALNNSSTFQ